MEVVARLQFITPCLGNVRRPNGPDRMLRTPGGEVMFLASWWRSALAYAAKAINRYQREIESIQPALEIRGDLKVYPRYYGNRGLFNEHEAFLEGAEVEVNFLLPTRMKLATFQRIMEVVGEYAGISPYGWKDGYGRFTVIDIGQRRRDNDRAEEGG